MTQTQMNGLRNDEATRRFPSHPVAPGVELGPKSASPPLVWLSAVTWDFPLVGRTRMLTEAWWERGRDCTFVQIPSQRTALQRLTQPLRIGGSGGATRSGAGPSQRILRPWPSYPSSLWPRIGESALRHSIDKRASSLRRLLERSIDLEAAVALVVSPVWTPWLDGLPFRSVIYDCIDDVEVMTPSPGLRSLLRRWEDELIQRASAAVASCDDLAQKLRERRSDLCVETIRNGVDTRRFCELAANSPAASDLPGRRHHTTVGFVGALYDWIDWRLVESMATRLPDFDFVFVGPVKRRRPAPQSARLPNVHLIGPRRYAQIPAYIAAFDVCWVPFRDCDVSRYANPVKIYEYLALGKPVVSTRIADEHSFEGHVRIGTTAGQIEEHLRKAATRTPSEAEDRVRFAERNTWSARADVYRRFATAVAAGSTGNPFDNLFDVPPVEHLGEN